MPHINDATAWALERYNNVPSFRTTTVEIGNVLYADRGSLCLLPGSDVVGPSGSAVRPYSQSDFGRMMLHAYAQQGDIFLGDYHCHVGTGLSWLAHYPSPADIQFQSCLCDMWELDKPMVLQNIPITDLGVASQFQTIQSNLFGDLFVLSGLTTRKPFASLQDQKNVMGRIGRDYATWHLGAHNRLGNPTFPISHAQFVAQVFAELPMMNAALGGRAQLTFIENTAYVSDDDEFLP